MKIKTTGKSIKELLEVYGTGSSGFYQQNWYKSEKFFTEKPEVGEWDIDFNSNLTNLRYTEQLEKIPKDSVVLHPAILCEAILSHFKETGVRLLEKEYSRTNTLDSVDSRVLVGLFDSGGLDVYGCWDGDRSDGLGLSAGKLLLNTGELETLENLSLENAVKIVKSAGYVISKII